jgi:hypothetical protein
MKMNALAITTAGLTRALTAFTTEPTLRDVHRWGWEQEANPYPRFLWAIEATALLKPDVTVSTAKARLQKVIARDEIRRAAGDWKFDANRLIAAKQQLAHIEAFEQRHARAA